ncbi:disulfide bond formation protein DsbB [Otariodibacter oris]|uniref:Disulfide bond formation protein B n=1 Tax=Otariodibacter oris TaxID=1032623 RepID=A0A420XGX4_9PAST|nr:disulfide bond formation protein DsbB [Otariodibacter oris]QGM81227.1 disulfide bond formation protein B [Otariodibacter oris]RKR72788.1 thiol:disulfide interchange protein DsbB [Otariodibacter oris]
MFSYLKRLSIRRGAWALLFASSLILELTALYFQHGMGLDPCVMCIYERVALLGVLISSLIAIIAPKFATLRWIALAIGLFSATKGLLLAIQHTDYQLNPAPWNQCSPFVEFPETLPLDKWFPAIFEPNGDCSAINWQLFGLSMPQWLIVVFSIYLIILILVTISQFKKINVTGSSRQLFR